MVSPDTNKPEPNIYLVTGGHGFLGSHVARRLFDKAVDRIRIVDIARQHRLEGPISRELMCGDLRDPGVCSAAVRGVHTVLHFAANMGGMGTIHEQNDFILYEENHQMTMQLLQASLAAGVKRFLYASSACVYPEELQGDKNADVSLRESDVWKHAPPKTQGLYGLEKLNSELLVLQFASRLDVRIARFHNVFGPGGAWNDGREKAPAAMLRKAVAMKLLDDKDIQFEIWGDGQQRRSFLYVDDAVDGVIKLLDSSFQTPFNIGSDAPISIQALAEMALRVVGVDPADVDFTHDQSKPLGVASRNSNNELARSKIDWVPSIPPERGMKDTGSWIQKEISTVIECSEPPTTREGVLRSLLLSKVIDLVAQKITFAILLPITSRGSVKPSDCLSNLRRFAASLVETTWRDVHERGGRFRFRVAVYLVIDADDAFLLEPSNNPAQILQDAGVYDVVTLPPSHHPPGHVCKLWKDSARMAWKDGCDYMVLMGDDVMLGDGGWMGKAHAEFDALSKMGVPHGFGCVAFTDTTFPGMPTFPIIHRTHMDIFGGEVIPDVFINQDGDPFLFQIYRRWGCSGMFSSRIANGVGGEAKARYAKQQAEHWTFETLDDAVSVVDHWLENKAQSVKKKLTLDVIIPCYRVDLVLLDVVLSLRPSPTCDVMFIIIVDNPCSPSLAELISKHSHRPDVRIRTNNSNLGASASRNRGLEESSADWVHFLDDDVVPRFDLLVRAEEIIRAHPNAAGFVGNSVFPVADTVFTTAVHLAGVTFFWDIATKFKDDVPWGVTANLIARRKNDGINFDLGYPKTGGGEDIDYCRRKRECFLKDHKEGFFVAAPEVLVTHPWWNHGARSYWRFYNWSVGDGALVKKFPEYTYRDFVPNSAESFFLCGLMAIASLVFCRWAFFVGSLKSFVSVITANILHDLYRHLYKHPRRTEGINSTLTHTSFWWVLAVLESSFIRMFSELGRLRGILARREYEYLGWRFDWFAGGYGDGPWEEERANGVQRTVVAAAILSMMYH
ncbi:glycosyltransferase family 2 protein [Hebeloma cylindrosporum]|uniref:Glycosyltransferase family 2 protein n=1 Tax=Hebeloma cylindrosporum TaxID=76867 RepID=A0A0C2Y9D9_HEBCY|nr:glycosyltransferase family 2 protein [Hebeloma cylindrosporum h7]